MPRIKDGNENGRKSDWDNWIFKKVYRQKKTRAGVENKRF